MAHGVHAKAKGRLMKVLLVGIAGLGLLSVAGCADYPGTLQTAMAQALPPYHQANTTNLDTAQGIKPVQSATHNWSIRVAPFF